MSILLFEDFTKLYKRWNKGEDRKEDEFHSNIDDFKTVDLGKDFPVLFADVDLQVDGVVKFTKDEVISMIPKIKKAGWRLPRKNELRKMFDTTAICPSFIDAKLRWFRVKYCAAVTSKETGETLYFPTNERLMESYWIGANKTDDFKIIRSLHVDADREYRCMLMLYDSNEYHASLPSKVRLVKDKK